MAYFGLTKGICQCFPSNVFKGQNPLTGACGLQCDGETTLTPTRFCGEANKIAVYKSKPSNNKMCSTTFVFLSNALK